MLKVSRGIALEVNINASKENMSIKDFVKNSHDRFTVQFSENLSLKYPSISEYLHKSPL